MLHIQTSGPWNPQRIETYLLNTVVPLRLAVMAPSGWPVLVSLWFFYDSGKIICASRSHSKIISLLSENPKCAFEVSPDSPPYHGVRGQGMAVLGNESSTTTLERLHDRFLGNGKTTFRSWLIGGASEEIVITILPKRIMSWDYSGRMPK